jgi:hypothetical protein
MQRTVDKQHRFGKVAITVMSLGLLCILGVPTAARADDPGAICVLKLVAEDKVVSVLANNPQNFNLAILVPEADSISIPIRCDLLDTLALGVANQANNNINVAVQIFTSDGGLICSKGPFLLAVNGGRGVTFADCP